MAKSIMERLTDKKGLELWHIILLVAVAALGTYFLMNISGAAAPVDGDGCAAAGNSIAVCCGVFGDAGKIVQVDCSTKAPTLQTMAIFEAPAGTVVASGIDAISFKYKITNTGNTDINANVASVTCKKAGIDVPDCSGPTNQLMGGGAFGQKTVAQGTPAEWQSNWVNLQTALPAGVYDLAVSITAQDTAGKLSPVTQQGALQFKNTPETVSFTVQVVNA